MKKWKSGKKTKIELGGVCTSLSRDYRSFLMKGKIVLGQEMHEIQFEFTVPLQEI